MEDKLKKPQLKLKLKRSLSIRVGALILFWSGGWEEK